MTQQFMVEPYLYRVHWFGFQGLDRGVANYELGMNLFGKVSYNLQDVAIPCSK